MKYYWRKIFSLSAIDVNFFLMELSVPIIKYLDTVDVYSFNEEYKDIFHATLFKTTGNEVPLSYFGSDCNLSECKGCSRHEFVLEGLMADYTASFFDLIYETFKYGVCRCYNYCESLCYEMRGNEFRQEVNDVLRRYMKVAFPLNELDMLRTTLSQDASSEFTKEYLSIEKKVLEKSMTFDEADAELLIWKDAMPDVLLQKAFILLRYTYIGYWSNNAPVILDSEFDRNPERDRSQTVSIDIISAVRRYNEFYGITDKKSNIYMYVLMLLIGLVGLYYYLN